MENINVYVDGGCSSNGFKNAKAYGSFKIAHFNTTRLIFTENEAKTNNEAEYLTLLSCLEEIKNTNISNANIFMDSLLVVNQVHGVWKNNKNIERLLPMKLKIQKLLKETNSRLTWVPRNKIVKILGH